jgi:hypothetical protein
LRTAVHPADVVAGHAFAVSAKSTDAPKGACIPLMNPSTTPGQQPEVSDLEDLRVDEAGAGYGGLKSHV